MNFSVEHIVASSSVIVCIVLNAIENLVHYNIGRNHRDDRYHIHFPTNKELLQILIAMTIFAIVQYYGTVLLYRFLNVRYNA